MKIGVPRALLYYNYYPAFKKFLEHLGHEVVTSQDTDREVLEKGGKLCVDDACLPLKICHGHVKKLLERDEIERVFLPRFIGVERNKFLCPKLFGLPNLISNQFDLKYKQLISPKIDLTKNHRGFLKELIKTGKYLGNGTLKTLKAYRKAIISQSEYEEKMLKGKLPRDILVENNGNALGQVNAGIADTGITDTWDTTIALLGHSYNINDSYINHKLVDKLRQFGIKIITPEMIEDKHKEEAQKKLEKPLFWTFGKDIIGSAYYGLKYKAFDGIILVVSFGCGPDSLINELVERELKQKIPLLVLTLDEHTGEVGINTRIEAFVEMIKRRKIMA